MANRYAVVLGTYPRRLFLGTLVLQVFLILCGLATVPRTQETQGLLVPMGNIGMGLFAVMIWLHVHEQFADSRALLLPRFAAPHLAAAAAISMAVLALTTVVVCWRAGTSIPGTAAAVLVPFTAIVWGLCQPLALLAMLLIMLFAGGAISAAGAERLPGLWYAALLEGRALPIALVLLVVCLGLLVMVGARIRRLNEDMPDNHRLMHLACGLDPATPETERLQWSVRQGCFLWEWEPRLLLRRMPAYRAGVECSFWKRVFLWRAAMSPVKMPIVTPFTLLPAGLASFLSSRSLEAAVDNLIPFPGLCVVLLGSAVSGLWLHRWPHLGYELLRPTTRQAFCRQMGLAFALDLFEVWLWNTLPFGLLVAVLSPRLFRGSDIAVFLCLTGVIPFLQWAVSAVVLSCSRSGSLLLTTVVVVSAFPAVLWTGYFMAFSPAAIGFYLSTALGTLLLCLATLYLAYRRWLNLDLA